MGKRRIIAETGAGQHGVATATVCARFGLECVVYMGAEDVARQALNVYRMQLLGATVVPVESGTRTLKDATNEALRDWVTNVPTTHYIIGSVVGPDPYPRMVRDFQAVIGREARAQMLERYRPPAAHRRGLRRRRLATRSASSPPSWTTPRCELVGVEAAGQGLESGHHSATLSAGTPGVLHGSLSYLLQDADGQVAPAHSVSAGLDYPGRRARSTAGCATPAGSATSRPPTRRRWTPSRRSAGWRASFRRWRPRTRSPGCGGPRAAGPRDQPVLVCLSGRGDKDVAHVARLLGSPA